MENPLGLVLRTGAGERYPPVPSHYTKQKNKIQECGVKKMSASIAGSVTEMKRLAARKHPLEETNND